MHHPATPVAVVTNRLAIVASMAGRANTIARASEDAAEERSRHDSAAYEASGVFRVDEPRGDRDDNDEPDQFREIGEEPESVGDVP